MLIKLSLKEIKNLNNIIVGKTVRVNLAPYLEQIGEEDSIRYEGIIESKVVSIPSEGQVELEYELFEGEKLVVPANLCTPLYIN